MVDLQIGNELVEKLVEKYGVSYRKDVFVDEAIDVVIVDEYKHDEDGREILHIKSINDMVTDRTETIYRDKKIIKVSKNVMRTTTSLPINEKVVNIRDFDNKTSKSFKNGLLLSKSKYDKNDRLIERIYKDEEDSCETRIYYEDLGKTNMEVARVEENYRNGNLTSIQTDHINVDGNVYQIRKFFKNEDVAEITHMADIIVKYENGSYAVVTMLINTVNRTLSENDLKIIARRIIEKGKSIGDYSKIVYEHTNLEIDSFLITREKFSDDGTSTLSVTDLVLNKIETDKFDNRGNLIYFEDEFLDDQYLSISKKYAHVIGESNMGKVEIGNLFGIDYVVGVDMMTDDGIYNRLERKIEDGFVKLQYEDSILLINIAIDPNKGELVYSYLDRLNKKNGATFITFLNKLEN